MTKFIALFLALALTQPSFAVTDTEKNERLKKNLTDIYKGYRVERYVGSGLAMGLGLYLGISSINQYASRTDLGSVLAYTLTAPLGFAIAGVGAFVLFIPTSAEVDAKKFLNPENSLDIKAKIIQGETILSSIATRSQRERYLGGAMFGALGIGYLIGYLGMDKTISGSSAFLIAGALFTAVTPLILIIKTNEEINYEDYKKWSSSDPKTASFKLNIAPYLQTNGAGAQLRMTF
jgi:hypothetical protein